MMEKNADFIFEVSWEVCNKVGGIHTVISSKMPLLRNQVGDNMIFIGPDLLTGNKDNKEFVEDKHLYPEWKKECEDDGLRIRIGRWKIGHNPIAILIDFSSFINHKDEILTHLWDSFQVDSLTGSWDYIESVLFGYTAGMVIERFTLNELKNKLVVAHFHEWMTGGGVLYLKDKAPFIATAFTTHATTLGRSIAGNGLPLYNKLHEYNPDQKSIELNIRARYSLEQKAAINADVFTTVSQVTANECKFLLRKEPDFITPNGFDLDHLPPITTETRLQARQKLCHITYLLTGCDCDPDTVFAAISGRYEFKNKGIDVFIDVLGKLRNNNLQHQVVGLVFVPANNYGVQRSLVCNLESNTYNPVNKPLLTHALDENAYDPVLEKANQLQIRNEKDDKVKLIFIPVYLNGNDGVFNMTYYELLSACDVSVFPSYYEPWGYTPHESIALGVPTITSSFSGFGQWMRDKSIGIEKGVQVVERNEDNYWDVVDSIVRVINRMNGFSASERDEIRQNSIKLAQSASWKDFIEYYLKAYKKAVGIAHTRVTDGNLSTLFRKKEKSKPVSNQAVWKKLYIQSDLPNKLSKLNKLAMNLWWCWNYDAIELFESVHPVYWEKLGKNPIALIKAVSIDRFKELEEDTDFIAKLEKVYDKFIAYMEEKPRVDLPKIAYFSMEYGLDDSVKIYSGGLGILAGDYLKEASDINCPLVGVGFLYKYGYFTQHLTISGEQQATMIPQNFDQLPIKPVFDDLKRPLTVAISMPGRDVKCKIWKLMVGRIPLYLLDTDFIENNVDDRGISHQLYGGDWENRLKQEMLLGLGGIRALKAMGISADVYHCNEGHAALINVERLSNLVQDHNLTFEQALEVVRASSLFTTHTPVPAGHDEFEEYLIRTYLRHMPDSLKIDWNTFLNLGRGHLNQSNEKFSMSVLAARTSQEMNGVSRLHGKVSRDMFHYMWQGYGPDELHIGYVTNGVHYPTWASSEWQKLYEKEFGKDFLKDQSNSKHWARIHNVKDEVIWEMRHQLRKKLIDYIKARFEISGIRRHENPKHIIEIQNSLSDKTLTIGFARRFATYKRAHLIFSDIDRLAKIVNDPKHPVQFLFAGKAHPNDKAGQDLIKRIVEISRDPRFVGKVLFLENYDMELAKRLVRGVDIWLNNPTRPLEASGTSGQKAEMNGVLNFSVLDGWWCEGYIPKAGWSLPEKRTYTNQGFQDELDAATIYSMLENEIIPLFYGHNEKGIPVEWVQFIKRSIAGIAWNFTTKRMIDDYINQYYKKLATRSHRLNKDEFKLAIELTAWKTNIMNQWESIEVVSVDFPNTLKNSFKMGELYHGEVVLDLKHLDESSVGVELVFALDNGKKIIDRLELAMVNKVDSLAIFKIDFELKKPGAYDYGIRIFPKHPELPHRQDLPYLLWV